LVSEINLEPVDEKEELRIKIDSGRPVEYEPVNREDINITLPISVIGDAERKKATLTLVVSDTHLGDSNHLPKTFWSCVENTKSVVSKLSEKFDIVNFIMVLNGDLVAGKDVFRYQQFRNLVQRGHWQTEIAAQVIRELKKSIAEIEPIRKTFIIKGNHEDIADNYMIYLTNYLDDTWYAGHYKVLNIAYPIGNYNVLFTHGSGKSAYYPVSYEMIRDCWKAFNQYKAKGVQIEEVCVGHTHWLQPRLYLEGLTFNVCGGFQIWEKTISQRPSGFLLFIHTCDETSVTGIRPDPEIEIEEQTAVDLEFTNYDYYGQKLRNALRYVKDRPSPDEVVI